MKQTKSATPYLLLLFALAVLIPYSNYRANSSQEIVVEVTSETTYAPKAQAAVLFSNESEQSK